MEMMFMPGEYVPVFNWDSVWFRFKKTEGVFTVPVNIWYRAEDNAWVTITGRKSMLGSSHADIRVYPDRLHVGRFIVSAHVKSSRMETALPLGIIYNDRKYKFKIDKQKRAWEVTFVEKMVSISVHRTPLMTLNSLARLSKKRTFDKKVIIKIEDVQDIQSKHKDS
jgi:hypothetical protein